jgi:hypothetical protein
MRIVAGGRPPRNYPHDHLKTSLLLRTSSRSAGRCSHDQTASHARQNHRHKVRRRQSLLRGCVLMLRPRPGASAGRATAHTAPWTLRTKRHSLDAPRYAPLMRAIPCPTLQQSTNPLKARQFLLPAQRLHAFGTLSFGRRTARARDAPRAEATGCRHRRRAAESRAPVCEQRARTQTATIQ